MPIGYRVNLNTPEINDNTLWYGDGVAPTLTEFADSVPRIGAGSILATGRETASGESFANRPIGGTFHASGSDVFFVPASSGLTIDSATVHVSPVYNSNTPINGSNTNVFTEDVNGTPPPTRSTDRGGTTFSEAAATLARSPIRIQAARVAQRIPTFSMAAPAMTPCTAKAAGTA